MEWNSFYVNVLVCFTCRCIAIINTATVTTVTIPKESITAAIRATNQTAKAL